jgi:hypothetical protein
MEPVVQAMTKREQHLPAFAFVPNEYRGYAAEMLERWRSLQG